jgi:hypothetical protein
VFGDSRIRAADPQNLGPLRLQQGVLAW